MDTHQTHHTLIGSTLNRDGTKRLEIFALPPLVANAPAPASANLSRAPIRNLAMVSTASDVTIGAPTTNGADELILDGYTGSNLSGITLTDNPAETVQASKPSRSVRRVCDRRTSGKRNRALPRMVIWGVCALSSGVAASADYEMHAGKGVPQCEYFVDALKMARVGDMTDVELCQIQQKPMAQWLNIKHIHDLSWQPYSASDPVQLAKSMDESTIEKKDLPKFKKSIDEASGVVKKLLATNNLYFETTVLSFPGQNIYILQAKQKRCPSFIGRSGTWMGSGAFFDRGLNRGVEGSFLPDGRLIYFFGSPFVMDIQHSLVDLHVHRRVINVSLMPITWDSKVQKIGSGNYCYVSFIENLGK